MAHILAFFQFRAQLPEYSGSEMLEIRDTMLHRRNEAVEDFKNMLKRCNNLQEERNLREKEAKIAILSGINEAMGKKKNTG
jgi:hypothetical protein